MKKIINKTTMAIILTLSMVLALLGGIFFARHNSEVANADAELTKVSVTADTASFFPGAEFTLTFTVQSNRANLYYNTLSFNIGPRDATNTKFDTAKCALMTFSDLVIDDQLTGFKSNTIFGTEIASSAWADKGLLAISEANNNKKPVEATSAVVFTVKVKLDDNVDPGTQFDIGIRVHSSNRVGFRDSAFAVSSNVYDSAAQFAQTSTIIEATSLTFEIKTPSTNNNLATLMAGQGTLASPADDIDFSDPDNMNVTVKDPSSPLDVQLTTEDAGATVKLMPGDIAVTGGKGSIPIPSDGVVTIVVTAEDGTPKNYKLKVKVVGAMLTALTATPDSATAGVTKGIKETFASSTLDYTVIVPNDSTKVTIRATVSTGNSAQTTMDVFTASGCTVPTTATSGTNFDVTNVSDGDKLTITCKASDGTTNSSKSYNLTFDVVDVNANLDSITVTGATTNTTFNSSAKKATANKVDYYYMVVGETNAASKVAVVAESSAATIIMDSASYNPNATLTEGQHIVTIQAEAGNTINYVFFLKNYVGLEIKDGKVADFLFEEEDSGMYYRRTYAEKGMVHGVDDIDFDRLVVGQIPNLTTVNAFLENFTDTTKIKLYTSEDELLFNLGTPEVADPDELDDADSYAVGTGWYIEYVVDGEVQETVYISVLGDLDGNGMFSSEDITRIGKAIKGIISLENVELRLAAYVVNFGEISADDISAVNDFIKKQDRSSNHFVS